MEKYVSAGKEKPGQRPARRGKAVIALSMVAAAAIGISKTYVSGDEAIPAQPTTGMQNAQCVDAKVPYGGSYSNAVSEAAHKAGLGGIDVHGTDDNLAKQSPGAVPQPNQAIHISYNGQEPHSVWFGECPRDAVPTS